MNSFRHFLHRFHILLMMPDVSTFSGAQRSIFICFCKISSAIPLHILNIDLLADVAVKIRLVTLVFDGVMFPIGEFPVAVVKQFNGTALLIPFGNGGGIQGLFTWVERNFGRFGNQRRPGANA